MGGTKRGYYTCLVPCSQNRVMLPLEELFKAIDLDISEAHCAPRWRFLR